MDNASQEVRLSDQIVFRRVGLKRWLELDRIWVEIHRYAAEKLREEFTNEVYRYLSVASGGIDQENFEYLPWNKIADTVLLVWELNRPKLRLPMYLDNRLKDRTPIPWEYPGRVWYVWANIFARRYGWTLEYIASLDVDDATALFQEVMVDEQLSKEWDWGLTELAYPYNSNTKKSEFKPLERPGWMRPKIEQPKLIKIRQDMMPVGNIIDLASLYGNKPD